MKGTVSFIVLLAIGIVSANPVADNQSPLNFKVEGEWHTIPDGEGNLHMIHTSELFEVGVEPKFDAFEDVVFNLFTRSNSGSAQVIRLDNAADLANSNFNPANPTRFTIHGWNGSPSSAVNRLSREAYLSIGDFNVITVDWSDGSGTLNYVAARNRVWQVGPVVARFIEFLETAGLNRNDVTIIGHSLGAHVAGLTGKRLPGGLIGTIIGLDSAGPLFYVRNPEDRLHIGDAQYVETIFTNAGTLGFGSPIGDASFYPNGGSSQPGCGLDVSGNCAHGRVNPLFAESITSNRFRSIPCHHNEVSRGRCTREGDEVVMGGEPSNRDRNVEGVFWLETGRETPFALG